MLTRQPLAGYLGCMEAIAETDLVESTARLRLPALGIAGTEDGSTPPDLVRETADSIPGRQVPPPPPGGPPRLRRTPGRICRRPGRFPGGDRPCLAHRPFRAVQFRPGLMARFPARPRLEPRRLVLARPGAGLTARGHVAERRRPALGLADPAALTAVTLDDDAGRSCAALHAQHRARRPFRRRLCDHPGRRAARPDRRAPRLSLRLCPAPRRDGRDLARDAPGHPLDGALDIDRAHRAYRFRDAALAANLYHDCPDGTLAFARARLGWQATGPQAETVAAPPPDIPAHYITCTRDRTIPPAQQHEMAAACRAQPATRSTPAIRRSSRPRPAGRLLDRIA